MYNVLCFIIISFSVRDIVHWRKLSLCPVGLCRVASPEALTRCDIRLPPLTFDLVKMPSATFVEPFTGVDEPSDVGSLEHLKSSDAFPKLKPQRVSSMGELQEPWFSSLSAGTSTPIAPTGVPEPPFPLLPGEYVRQFGQISMGTQLFLTNFRLFALLEHKGFYNIALPAIDSVEARDMFYLVISCRDGRIVK